MMDSSRDVSAAKEMVTSYERRRPSLLVYSVLIAVACLLSGCDVDWDYDVFVQYYCMDFNGQTGFCARWQQIGEINAPYGACFPGNTVVMSEDGLMLMQDLRVGDRILGLDHSTGRQSFSEVRGWLHRNPMQTMSMMELHTEDGLAVVTSPGHMLALSNDSSAIDGREALSYRRASDIRPGDTLVSANGSSIAVEETMSTKMEGLFAPLTMHSNYFVGSGEVDASKLVLAHSFANIADPQRYERFWHGLLSVIETIAPSFSSSAVEADSDYLHPIARLLMRLLGVTPVEPMVFEAEYDVGARGEVKGRRLKSVSSGGLNDDEWMFFFMSIMQTAQLPPFMANLPNPPTTPTDSFTRTPFEEDDDDDDWTVGWHIFWVTLLVLVCCCCCVGVLAAAGGASSKKTSRYDEQDGTPAESRPLAEGAAYYDDEDALNNANDPNYGPYGSPPPSGWQQPPPPGWQSQQQPPPGSWGTQPPGQNPWQSQTPNWGSSGPPSAGPATPGPSSGYYNSGPPSVGQTMPPYQSAPNPYQSAANPYDTNPPYYAQSYPS